MLIVRVGFNINKKVTDEILYKDRDSQIKAINATFEAASKPVRIHPNVFISFGFIFVFIDFLSDSTALEALQQTECYSC